MSDIKNYWEKSTPMNFKDEKWPYEKKRAFRYELQDYMHDSFQFDKWCGKKVLEIGCGSGVDSLEFARNGAIVTSTDITANACQLTRGLSDEYGYPPLNVVQLKEDCKLPFQSNTFDCVYSYGVLHHIPNVDVMLAEITRVLKPGGQLMTMLYNRDSLLFAYYILYLNGMKQPVINTAQEEIDKLSGMYSERNIGCPYTRCYTKATARELLERHGFEDVTVDVRYNVIDTPEQRKVKIGLPDGLELGWHLVVKGIKPE
jgi:ubiquinone/menaquinone biosynthesis C-methylase UbiE